MQQIIKDHRIQLDDWLLVEADDALLEQNQLADRMILPFGYVRANHLALTKSDNAYGVWLDGNTDVDAWGDVLVRFPMLAIRFSSFTDGRGFSLAMELREKFGFAGELRAIGDILPDQLNYLQRCGFTSYCLANIEHQEDALLALSDLSVAYQ